ESSGFDHEELSTPSKYFEDAMFNRIFVSFCLVLGSFLHGDEESPTKTEKPIFISGVAGFIGFSLANHLLDKGYEIYGCDNLLPYYDVKLKEDRLAILLEKGLNFYPIDVRE